MNRSLFFLALTATSALVAAEVDDVEMHLLEKDERALVHLYRLHTDPATETEAPLSSEITLEYLDCQKAPHDYYVQNSLVYTDFCLGHNSSLWFHWAGFELHARRLWLREDPVVVDSFGCDDWYTTWSCVFDGKVSGHDVQVALFKPGTHTTLPRALYKSTLDKLTVRVVETAQDITVHGPFELGDEDNIMVIAESVRHGYNFALSPKHRRARITDSDAHQVTDFEDVLLTVVVVYASITVVYTWSLPHERPSSLQKAIFFPLAVVPWFHLGSWLRYVQLILFTLHVVAPTIVHHVAPRLFGDGYAAYTHATTSFVALESLYTATVLLHETTVNMASSVVAAATVVVAFSFYFVQKAPAAMRALDFVLLVVTTANFVVYNAEPYLRLDFAVRYGLDPWPLTLFVTALLFELGLHIVHL